MPYKTTQIDVIEATGAERGEYPEALWPLFDPEEGMTLEATVSARMVRNDYGVPGSPVWFEAEDLEIDLITLNGVEYTVSELHETYGGNIADRLEAYIFEAADKIEWDHVPNVEFT